MKKLLFIILICLIYHTTLSTPITSPIYIPESGKILSNLNVGYDKFEFNNKKALTSYKLSTNGLIGIFEILSLNYNVEYLFHTKNRILNGNISDSFNAYGIGLTFRTFKNDFNILDIILNVGKDKLLILDTETTPFFNISLKYGLNFSHYNTALTFTTEFLDKYVQDLSNADFQKQNSMRNYILSFENEIIITNTFTIGLDFLYKWNDEINNINYSSNSQLLSFYKLKDNFTINTDLNYAINDNNYIALYYMFTSLKSKYNYLDSNNTSNNISNQTNIKYYSFGLKLTTYF